MKCLSVRQPWAWLLVNGYKPVENRTWRTNYRGRLLIHAGRSVADAEAIQWLIDSGVMLGHQKPRQFQYGGIIGAVSLYDCVETFDSPYFFGPYGFAVNKAISVPFYEMKGQLGIFEADVPEWLRQAAREDLG